MKNGPLVLRHRSWAAAAGGWDGIIPGEQFGTLVTLVFSTTETLGAGSTLHEYPYDVLMVMMSGHSEIRMGDLAENLLIGDILSIPAGTPHRISNLGPGRLDMMGVHSSPAYSRSEAWPDDTFDND